MVVYYQNYISDKKYFKIMLIEFFFYDARNVKYILKFYFGI